MNNYMINSWTITWHPLFYVFSPIFIFFFVFFKNFYEMEQGRGKIFTH